MKLRTTLTAATAVYRPEYARRLMLGCPRSLMLFPVSINVGDTRLALAGLEPILVSYKPPNYFAAIANAALSLGILIFLRDIPGAPAATLVIALFAAIALVGRTTLREAADPAALRYTVWGRPSTELLDFARQAEEARFREILRVDGSFARRHKGRC